MVAPVLVSAATQGYKTNDTTISKGMAVAVASTQSTDTTVTTQVEKSTIAQASSTLGVVVDPGQDLVTVSTSGDQVYVANSGLVTVYATDINGPVKFGDLLAPSPIAGVLMKANQGSVGILGVAQEDFPSKTAEKVSVQNESGQTVEAKVALVRLNMDVKFSTSNEASGKSLLERIGEAVVRRPVNTTQVVVAMVILTILLLVEGTIIYGAINSSIVSLGRNPLAKRTIMRGLGQIIILVMIVLGLGLAAVYLVLWI
ncbi:MAG: hypothetical protein ABIQ89_03115 [Candidatus Saccharimonadales bacterium]